MQETLFAENNDSPEPDLRSQHTRSMIWETLGVTMALIALFLFIALFVGKDGESLIGPVGEKTAGALHWLLGHFISFLIPIFIMWFSIQLFRGRMTSWSITRVLGIVTMMIAFAGMLALPHADAVDIDLKNETFYRAGAIGVFLVEWDGLRLVGSFGTIGAAMILVTLALVGLVMITGLRFSEIFAVLILSIQNRRLEVGSLLDRKRANIPLPGEEEELDIPLQKKEKNKKNEPFEEVSFEEEPDELDEEVTAEKKGLFSSIFGRKKGEATLAEPEPEEMEDLDDLVSFDEDALAAARALEEARIDEEYEKALQDEVDGEVTKEEKQQEILFTDSSKPLETIDGNPANSSGAAMADGLAKLFPSRWEKEGDEVLRVDPNSDENEKLLDGAENRALRKMGKSLDDDPLFDETIDARPAGVDAAREAAAVSAMEREEEIAERNRVINQYQLPDVKILQNPPAVDNRMPREEMIEITQVLEKTFNDFGIQLKVTEVKQGPVVTRFELKPAPGVKVSKIVSLEHDIALAMKAQSVRIVAPIPGKAAVGIEIPNRKRSGVYLKELVSCSDFWEHPSPLGFALGKTIDGQPYFTDLKKMPHLLIAGATGAGKSVCLNTIICSFLYRMRPDRLRLLLVDPKRVEMSIYQGIPHLISPVVCDAKRAAAALHWAVEQMEDRYKKLVELKVRNIDGYNDVVLNPDKASKMAGKTYEVMPHLVIVVDELADLMVVAKNEVEESIQRLAQMARAVGIHLILATQRPSVNVITGIIKANFPTRVAFQVRQKVDSRTILDSGGAESLLGRGDMLYAPAGAAKPIRLQGAFLSDEEVESVVDHCKDQAPPMYDVEEFQPLLSDKEQKELAKLMGVPEDMDDLAAQDRMVRGTNQTMGKVTAGMFVPHEGGSAQAGDDEIDEALVRAAARIILEGRKGSTSLIQRRLKVGFARAGRLMDMLEDMGIVGPYKGSKPRDLNVDPEAALDALDSLEEQIQKTGSSQQAAAAIDGDSDLD